jgi:hypothetical protein
MPKRTKTIKKPRGHQNMDTRIAAVTNPVLLWLFRHGWEDPNWGQHSMDQITIGLAIHALAAKISDPTAAKAIQKIAAQAVTKTAQNAVKESL